ncbi:hypothetical protein COTS27_01485 [Spirochaetota bacterium]|nr:hypothetical protein COTS27_01485 [Spirochaetota bacterium]
MKLVISPAKTFRSIVNNNHDLKSNSQPYFSRDTTTLIKTLKTLSSQEIGTLMTISPKLADLNYERYQNWTSTASKQNVIKPQAAIFSFDGDVYRGIDIGSYTKAELKRLGSTVFILSGLYGLLKPFDRIKEYRLEMGTGLKVNNHKDLYAFWNDRVAKALLDNLSPREPLINLASQEYFKVIKPYLGKTTVVTPIFKENVRGTYKIVSFKSKVARGMMTSYIVKNNLKKPEDLTKFTTAGYRYDKKTATPLAPTFIRD